MSTTEKFTRKADLYAKYRPGYPQEFINYLCNNVGLGSNSNVADIGSGTGILSKQLLDAGCRVFCVEPNDNMRQIAENNLKGYSKFLSVNGKDENSTLEKGSIDFITVAQAFHWFDLEKFRLECQRILKPAGKVVLVWNSKVEDDPATCEREKICRRYCPDFKGFAGGQGTAGLGYSEKSPEKPENCISFFKDGDFEFREFKNNLYSDLENFIGGVLSSSYAPNKEDKDYMPFVGELTELFRKFSIDGVLVTPNVTRSYVGEV